MSPFYILSDLSALNWSALATGFFALGIIGLGFFWVIRAEYHLGYLWWPYAFGLGLLMLIATLFIPDAGYAALLGIVGASFIWGATEMKEQAVRGEIGLFPFNPKPKPNPPFVKLIRKIKAPHL